MPLVFSPLGEDVLNTASTALRPGYAFVMRQLGKPPELDKTMAGIVNDVFKARGVPTVDANASVGGKDFLERILGLIRATGFTVAIFSDETRSNSLANIALELGFAAMCGKPLVIVKSKEAKAPSDLTRTDWIVYDPDDVPEFKRKLSQALDLIAELADYQGDLLESSLNARSMDCAIAFERANKAFLLSGDEKYILAAETIAQRLDKIEGLETIDDLDRLKTEIELFIAQARRSKAEPKPAKRKRAKSKSNLDDGVESIVSSVKAN